MGVEGSGIPCVLSKPLAHRVTDLFVSLLFGLGGVEHRFLVEIVVVREDNKERLRVIRKCIEFFQVGFDAGGISFKRFLEIVDARMCREVVLVLDVF